MCFCFRNSGCSFNKSYSQILMYPVIRFIFIRQKSLPITGSNFSPLYFIRSLMSSLFKIFIVTHFFPVGRYSFVLSGSAEQFYKTIFQIVHCLLFSGCFALFLHFPDRFLHLFALDVTFRICLTSCSLIVAGFIWYGVSRVDFV